NAEYGLAATRVITALCEDGPEVVVTVQKVLTKPALSDNFSGGFSGHLLAPVEAGSGKLRAAYGRRPEHRYLLTRFSHHPSTGTAFEGFELPQWPALIE